ncbi:putative nucleic-acid-binding protein containing a Zn-ribbon (plasmid) [Phaeobacter inhibens]|uniref:Nucleic-acid-binding protein containing a Zn-ribbon n=1 Tax=Phaeobacter inhibens TaxID=221822 RepID=A0ABM6RKU4_9RHOB|nr:OB-fold domain-containing protein [Phaeobacter inhibens]AUQ52478.1 putative nucleic-acid-binding protein containing a Zn-ribbon [Phaeobacter inhibens]AUQ97083.1 putative nucleic-acid-binding protein containing a Zn-ribbon [Phaeobacter inhibens]AUR22283.1 putative nucleic-acid-binding protein containing a Zn-ribbon [Phaeobacter inhibens]
MTESRLPTSPEMTEETATFWQAANEGRLLVKHCLGSGRAFHPPRNISPFTGLAETEWRDASGTGVIYSFSVMRRHEAEHCIAYVQLSEGPIILSALTDCNFDRVEIGQLVRVVFVPTANGQMVPMFTPEAEG